MRSETRAPSEQDATSLERLASVLLNNAADLCLVTQSNGTVGVPAAADFDDGCDNESTYGNAKQEDRIPAHDAIVPARHGGYHKAPRPAASGGALWQRPSRCETGLGRCFWVPVAIEVVLQVVEAVVLANMDISTDLDEIPDPVTHSPRVTATAFHHLESTSFGHAAQTVLSDLVFSRCHGLPRAGTYSRKRTIAHAGKHAARYARMYAYQKAAREGGSSRERLKQTGRPCPMSNAIIDDGDNWTVPSGKSRVHEARVRLLQAGIALEILSIPENVTPRARKMRITKTMRGYVNRFLDWMSTTHIHSTTGSATVQNRAAWLEWWNAANDARAAIEKAMQAGDDLAAFLFNDGGVSESAA